LRDGETRGACSFLADDLLDVFEDGIAIHHGGLRIIENPLSADYTFRVDQKKRPDRGHDRLVENPISSDDFPFDEVAQQRIRQLQGFGERLLRERIVGADGEDLNIQSFEPFIVGLPGRKVRGSGWHECRCVELKEDPLLASKVTEADVNSVGARQLEVRRLISYLKRRRYAGGGEQG
jgi:hypothetical protein